MLAGWSTLSQAERDAAYNNNAAVADSAALIERRNAASLEFRSAHPVGLDVSYGPGPRQRFALFAAKSPAAPCLVFIHGGYWQRNTREDFACYAEGVLAHGWSAALPSHTLAPDATLTQIVGEIGSALDWLAANGPKRGLAGGPIVVSGWSAGGHLTSMALQHSKVRAGMAISGIYDLEPIRHSYLNEKLRADEATSRRNSPVTWEGGPLKPLSLVVGSAELPLLRKQTANFAGHRARYGLPVTYEEIPGADHFTIMHEMMSPKGRITTLIRQLFERTAS
jgi:arylformamidase